MSRRMSRRREYVVGVSLSARAAQQGTRRECGERFLPDDNGHGSSAMRDKNWFLTGYSGVTGLSYDDILRLPAFLGAAAKTVRSTHMPRRKIRGPEGEFEQNGTGRWAAIGYGNSGEILANSTLSRAPSWRGPGILDREYGRAALPRNSQTAFAKINKTRVRCLLGTTVLGDWRFGRNVANAVGAQTPNPQE
jgi:hypothetical protein